MQLDIHSDFDACFGHVQSWYSDFAFEFPDLAPVEAGAPDLDQLSLPLDDPAPAVSVTLQRAAAKIALCEVRNHLATAQRVKRADKEGNAWIELLQAARCMGKLMPIYDLNETSKEVQELVIQLKIKAIQLLFSHRPEGGWTSYAQAYVAINSELCRSAEAMNPPKKYTDFTERLKGWRDDPIFNAFMNLCVTKRSASAHGSEKSS